jgi:hypothetical protein
VPGGFRRRAAGVLVLLIFAPALLAAGLVAAAQVVQVIEHIIALLWPYAVAVLLLLAGAYVFKALYYRRRW